MDDTATTIQEVFTPAFVVDLDVVEKNCQRFLKHYEDLGIEFRPHMKTHKTLEIGSMMTGGKKRKIVVSTLAEAEFFAEGGFDDIFYASPVIQNRVKRVSHLMDKLDSFHVMVDSLDSVDVLLSNPQSRPWSVFVAVDVGYGREGILPHNPMLLQIADKMLKAKERMEVKAFYSHCGHSYASRGIKEIQRVAGDAVNQMMKAVELIKEKTSWEGEVWGIGSTPTCSQPPDSIAQMTEVHPGNYVFNDVMQTVIGSCKSDEIAGKVLTSVISHRKPHNAILVDAGFLALTAQTSDDVEQGYCVVEDHPELKMVKLTQEIGTITARNGELDFEKYPIGSKLTLLPYHSCATAAQHSFYWVHRQSRIVDRYFPCRGF